MRMFSSTLRRNARDGTLDDLQQCLLYTLAGDIPCNRDIFTLLRNLIDLVNIDDAVLGALDIIIRRLNQLQQNVLHVLADIAGLCQCRRIRDCKRHVDDLRQCLRQIGLAGACRSDHNDIALLQLHLVEILRRGNTLIVVIHCYRQYLLCLVLSNHILIQKVLDLHRL